jgi:hypothetical protein
VRESLKLLYREEEEKEGLPEKEREESRRDVYREPTD